MWTQYPLFYGGGGGGGGGGLPDMFSHADYMVKKKEGNRNRAQGSGVIAVQATRGFFLCTDSVRHSVGERESGGDFPKDHFQFDGALRCVCCSGPRHRSDRSLD